MKNSMKYLFSISLVLIGSFVYGMNVQTQTKSTSDDRVEELKTQVFDIQHLKELIPAKGNGISARFKKHLSLPSPIAVFQHAKGVSSVSLSSGGNHVLTGSDDRTAKLWNAHTGNIVHTFPHAIRVRSVSFSPDESKILTSENTTAKLWDVSTGNLIHTFQLNEFVNSISFSPDGNQVLTGLDEGAAKLWDTSTGVLLHTFQHAQQVTATTFSPDSRQILTASRDCTAKLWDVGTRNLIRTFQHSNLITSVSFSPDGNQILTGSWDTTAKLWNAHTGNLINTFQHDGWVSELSFSPDGRKILTSSDNITKLWDAETGNLLHILRHTSRISSVSFSPNGNQILTGSWDTTVKLWNTHTGNLINTLECKAWVTSVSFSADGNKIIACCGNIALLWDPEEISKVKHFFEGLNINQSEMLKGFEVAIRERGRMHWNLAEHKYREYYETFRTFPLLVQQDLRFFLVLLNNITLETENEFQIKQSSSSSTNENPAEKTS